jgi:group I intron endonuclease
MQLSGIYKIESLLKPERFYIGSAVNINSRWARHKKDLRENKHHSSKLQNHYNKYGEADLVFTILEPCLPEFNITREQFHIDNLHPFFNCAPTAGSCLGCVRTEEFKKERSAQYKGKVNKGVRRSNMTKKKMRKYRLGSHLSKATILKIITGNKQNSNHKKKEIYTFYHPSYGVEICTMFELRTKYQLKKSMLSQLCSGQLKKSKGWILIN